MFNCDNSTVLKVVLLVKNALDLIKIIAPIILIIWAILDIVRLIVSDMSDEKEQKTKKKIINRFLAVIFIFLIPTIVNIVMTTILEENIESTACWINASEEYIEKLKAEEEKLEEEKRKADEEIYNKTEEQKRKDALEIRHSIVFSKGMTETKAGESANISESERMNYLFPGGVPTTQSAMQQYLTNIEVTYKNKDGKKITQYLTVHKKLASEIQAVFEDMLKIGFPINSTYCYSWRTMASGTGSLSHHSYGVAIDINATSNGAPYTSWGYAPGVDPYSVTDEVVAIWKKHGFFWGGDWSGNYKDPMHFTYTNH